MTNSDLLIEVIAANNFNPKTRMNQMLKLNVTRQAYTSPEGHHWDNKVNKELVNFTKTELGVFVANHMALEEIICDMNPEVKLKINKK